MILFVMRIGKSHRPMDRQPDRVLIRPDNSMFAMCGEKHVPAGTEESLASPILELNASRPLNHHHPLVTLLIVPEPFRRRVSVRCNPFDADVPVLDQCFEEFLMLLGWKIGENICCVHGMHDTETSRKSQAGETRQCPHMLWICSGSACFFCNDTVTMTWWCRKDKE